MDISTTQPALVALTDHDGREYARLDYKDGRVYDLAGKYLRTLDTDGTHGDNDRAEFAKLSALGIHDPTDLCKSLSLYAANFDVEKRGAALRKKLQLKDAGRRGETRVLMDLSPTDVHIASAMPNVAFGYHLLDGVADIALPIIPANKQSDKYFTWASGNAFTPAVPTMGGVNGGPSEISPALSSTQYSAIEYALASFITTEIEANADSPLQPYQAAADLVMNKLRMAREMRAAAALTTSANWNANNVLALTSGLQWNSGTSSDPIANIQFIQERSYDGISRIVMGAPVFHALQRNASVRQYHFAKSNDPALPGPQELSRILELPPIVVAEMKYTNAAGLATYVWPSVAGSASSVVLLHEPAQNPPTSGRDVATGYTFRWTGAPAPDGTLTGGFLVRSYYDPKRNGRGGRVIVILHNDAEIVTGPILGGLITGVLQ